MESFYGGRQGASFVIVKRFDAIEEYNESNPAPNTANYYKVDASGKIVVEADGTQPGAVKIADGAYLVKRCSQNYNSFSFKAFKNDGSTIEGTSYKLPTEYAKSMIECFKQGATSCNEVNYGEYVIIDTIENLHAVNHPDNGKVFRRGLNLQSDLAGAEYIGQIVGPTDETVSLNIDDYDTIDTDGDDKYKDQIKIKGEWSVTNSDLIPGNTVIDEDTGKLIDGIKYVYTPLRDACGNTVDRVIGFKIPYLVVDYNGASVSPYDTKYATDYQSPEGIIDYRKAKYKNLLEKDSEYYDETTQTWKNPFYHKWNVNIPQGINGDSASDFIILSTATIPKNYGGDKNYNGATLYIDEACLTAAAESFNPMATSLEVVYESNGLPWYYSKEHKNMKVSYSGKDYYVKNDDCYKDQLFYKQTTYGQGLNEDGSVKSSYVSAGYVENIADIYESESGNLVIVYTETDVDGTPVTQEFQYNYIKETIVTEPQPKDGYKVKPYHLLVYYSNAKYRSEEIEADKKVKYKGNIVGEKEDWADLGCVRGEAGGIHIIKDVTNKDTELKNNDGTWKKPEEVMNDPAHAGWCCTLNNTTLLFFDYEKGTWYDMGTVSTGGGDGRPVCIIVKSEPQTGTTMPKDDDVTDLKDGGFWLGAETALSAQ